jgi:hypothetical protein
LNLEEAREALQDAWSITREESKELLIPICEALVEGGVTQVGAQYCGSDDEGALEEISYLPEGAAVSSELRELVESWITATLPRGWEIDAGAQGQVAIDVGARTAQFDHEENYASTSYEPFQIGGVSG